MAESENDDVPPLSEQTRRPLDTALRQQRVKAWYPILDPWWVVGGFLVIGIIFVPTGFHIQKMSNELFERVVQYDAYDNPHPTCGINSTTNAGTQCSITITVDKDVNPPILIYYEIENFHQNHRKYTKSRDLFQLYGSLTQSSVDAENCNPLNILGDIRLNPCGLIANTLFNDVINLTSGVSSDGGVNLIMSEEGIAWQSDLDYMYRQPDGFQYDECPGACDASCCDGEDWSCKTPTVYKDGKCYRYFYPNDDTTQYLYETYPDIISPIDGVLNEHFVVWMRVAALPTFRKLYGWINQPIAKGTNLTFQITNNWEVQSFNGRKSLVVSNSNMFGGKNVWMGLFFYSIGFFCMGAAVLFALKQLIRPRRVADKRYLHFKQD